MIFLICNNGLTIPPALLLLILLGLPPGRAAAQPAPDTLEVDPEVERLLEIHGDEDGDVPLAELLAEFASTPLDLNTATAAELTSLPALSPLLASRILQHRRRHGPFASPEALRAVEGMTADLFHQMRPYITAQPAEAGAAAQAPLRNALHDLRLEVIQQAGRRLPLGRGYGRDSTAAYPGSPDRLTTRLRVRHGRRLSLGLTLEKDPGEPLRWDPATRTYLYDHVSFHAALQNVGRLERLVVGDFVANFGQGLVLWRSSAFGKGQDPVGTAGRLGAGVVPYASTEENRFFRGGAAALRLLPGVTLTVLGSRRRLDARLPEAGGAGEQTTPEVSALSAGGLHRLPREIAGKDGVTEVLFGGSVSARVGRGHVGVVGYRSRFDRPFAGAPEPYRRFAFSGREARMAGVYGQAFLGEALLFGEVARGPGGAAAGVGGVHLPFGRRGAFLLLARRYPARFRSLHGQAFGERRGTPSNEEGFYAGLRLRPAEAWSVAAYFDQYRFPWLRYGVPRPSTGHEALVVVTYRPRRWLEAYLQARTETKEAGTRVEDLRGLLLPALQPTTRRSLRLNGAYEHSPQLRLRARLEGVREVAKGASAQGVLLYGDVRWSPRRRLQLHLRLTFFDAAGARVYAYENDLLYAFSVPGFTGRGQRSYLLLKVGLLPRLDLQVKAAATRYEDVRSTGSGLDRAEGNRVREVRGQVRWRL